ncbi:ATP-binding protein [Mesonia aquimarina]|uniref:ATP-binding protein n=1 Tax=Mesonia aquimarina TaxID=1504967 RepID=UPI000EF59F76|nr:ATP-binding protein [Mesonia aquimarina]
MSQENYAENVTIINCDKEPIHIIPQIQTHGFLLVCDPSSLKITQGSDNTITHINVELKKLLNQPIEKLLPSTLVKELQEIISNEKTFLPKQITLAEKEWLMIPHLENNHLILDFEPTGKILDPLFFQEQLTKILNELDAANSISEMCQQAASLVKYLFDYDRVMLYKFDEEWNGKVIAEEKEDEMQSWLGLHYPATDIPKPARDIFLKQGVRMISDVYYESAAISPVNSPINNAPLNLSKSEIRGVSPIHIEYLKNMKVSASLTAAVVLNGKLWGLLACHHNTPKFVSYHQRQSCKFLTQVFSNKLALKTTNTFLEKIAYSENIRKKLMIQMRSMDQISRALCKFKPKFTDLIECGGGAVYLDGKLSLCGKTPDKNEVLELIEEILNKEKNQLFHTQSLMKNFPSAEKYKHKASGILSVRVGSEEKENYLIWFRPEESQVVDWGGNPEKNGVVKDGVEYLSPRKSFERWSEKVSGVSSSWQAYDFEAANSLQDSITYVIVQQQKDKISTLNEQLVEANQELETFSYSVSHDLRAPLRGIDGYAHILKEEYSDQLEEYGQEAIQTIIESAEEMDILIEDILTYAKAGKGKLQLETFSLKRLVENILVKHNVKKSYPSTEIIINENLPKIEGDRRMISQLINNLLGNALKYSTQVKNPKVEIGYKTENEKNIFFVKDNGIGFDPSLKDKIFDVFSRLAGDDYAGSGIGLAIAKKVVDKHDGEIWVETKPDKGSTFYFTLLEEER